MRQGRRSRRGGRAAELIAAIVLRTRGYRIIARNRVVGRVEADLIALDPKSAALVIVEVKSAAAGAADPFLRVDARKRARLEGAAVRIASARWLRRGGGFRAVRFDVVTVRWRRWRLPRIRHVIGAWNARR